MIRRASAPTEFGPIPVFWKLRDEMPVLIRVLLPLRGRTEQSIHPDSVYSTCTEVESILSGMVEMLSGKPVTFYLSSVDMEICSDFQRRVLLAEYAIPRGSVSTYNLIAEHIGVPGGARAVGNALARNPFPLIIPCHRAVRSNLTTGGFQGGEAMKKILLESEGITFSNRGRIQNTRLHYSTSFQSQERQLT